MSEWLTARVDPRALGLARIIVGSAAVIRTFVAWRILTKLVDETTLRVPYAEWIPQPTAGLVFVIVALWFTSAIAFTVGWRVRIAGPLLLASIVSTLALDQQTYSNHLYLMAWLVLLLTIADAGAGMNLERVDRPVVRWPILLVLMQISIVYGYSALTKVNEGFVSGAVLASSLRGGIVPFPDSLRTQGILTVLALVVVAVELFVAVFLWRTRFRPAAFILGLGLHISIVLFMSNTAQLLVFSLEMISIYPLFLSAEPLVATAHPGSRSSASVRRFDLLRQVRVIEREDVETIALQHHGIETTDAAAHTRILEHLVPWLWVAPLLRLPVVSQMHRRFCRAAAPQRNSPVAGSRGRELP